MGRASLLATLILVVWVAVGSAARDDTTLVSRASGSAGAKGNSPSGTPSISADGRLVAFESKATNLDPGDSDSSLDVFVRDLQSDRTELVSRASGPGGVNANDDSEATSISANGRFVVFVSTASNLHSDDSDSTRDVFVRDLQTNTTTLVSRASGPAGAKGNETSWAASISADGRLVAFSSGASNLHPDDTDVGPSGSDVFARDLHTDTTVLVSRASGVVGAKGQGGSYSPSVSADGTFVAFSSGASNLDPDDRDDTPDVFVRDLRTGTTTLVSRASGEEGEKGNNPSGAPAISAEGHHVAFPSEATNLNAADGDSVDDVFVRGLKTHRTALVSRASGPSGAKPPTDGSSRGTDPSISADGRLVAYASWAPNLHPYDSDAVVDVFVRDVQTETTALVSRVSGPAGPKANGTGSLSPSISGDGRFVAFYSWASNLHPSDTGDDSPDVFVRELGDPPLARPPRLYCGGKLATSVLLPRYGWIGENDRPNVIVGSKDADEINSGLRADLVCGRAGRDRIDGGRGRDLLDGGAGSDLLDGGAGRDRIRGGRGNDFIPTAGRFADRVDCGRGYDRVIADPLDRVRRCERMHVRDPRRRR